ncbi:MAG: GGDEF domain-containing protein [Angustibacter sp.]
MSTPSMGALVPVTAFGPLDLLSVWAHELYLDAHWAEAVQAAAAAMVVARGAGDQQTLRYLHYTCGVSLVQAGRCEEAAEHAEALLALLGPQDHAWRAKALVVLADASLQLGRIDAAVDAMAEACWLVEQASHETYEELSATMIVAMILGAAQFFDDADEFYRLNLTAITERRSQSSPAVTQMLVLVVFSYATMHLTWGMALELDGHGEQGRRHYCRASELALWLRRLTDADDIQMRARSVVLEAFAHQRLGQIALGSARIAEAMDRFECRPDQLVTQIGHHGIATALTEDGHYAEARAHLQLVLGGAVSSGQTIWELAALSALADIEIAEHGDHPALAWAVQGRQVASRRLWLERQGQFLALRDRIRVRELVAESSRLGHDVLVDPLTGLGNRRALDAELMHTAPKALLFVDVDRFKEVNDRFSHVVGDQVLCLVADLLRAHCRPGDTVVRFGGDEFLVLLPGASAQDAADIGERIRRAVVDAAWGDLAAGLVVSVSIGVTACEESAALALAQADAALYAAKRSGRDQVVIH